MDRTEENRQEYKELQRRVKREVSKAKQKAYDELYTRLDTREGEKDLYRLARQRDRDGKDVQQVSVIKDRDGRVLTSEESVQRRWKEYFEELMNEENEREKRGQGMNSVEQKVDKIRKDEVRKALKRMKSGKAVGPDDIPVEVWKCLGEAAVDFLTSLFNRVLENLEKAYDRVPREELWYCMRKSGVAEKYVRVVQDMYERSRTVVRCAVGQKEEFKVEVGLHQGSALSPSLFVMVMDQLSEEVRQESPWTMMFADDIVICSESREQVEENLERWRFALERRGMKVSRIQSNGECGKEVKKRVQAETVSLRKRQESELEVAELKMLRFSLGVTRLDRIRNEYIRGTAHVGRLGDKVRESRLRWFGHVQRRENLEKVYDRVPREELWYCMRKSGVAEKYVRVVQDMYERSRTVVRCAVGQKEEFKVEVGLHQGSALSPSLFVMVMDQLSEEVRQESPWTMMFADDIVICSESREQVEENLERWRFALERRGMKVSRSKTEYMCVNEREGSGTVRLQGEEVKKVQEFKYLGSTVQSNGECGKEVKKQVQAGCNGWRKVSGVLCDRKISARIKGKVYRTVVRAAMLYGLETVSLRKRQESEHR
ncbi:hypothetical protein QTP86_001870 [Hemibagrus guttatus]|nr:hypothetical protein QTP86_001870 [Hemibagrus guttatus]